MLKSIRVKFENTNDNFKNRNVNTLKNKFKLFKSQSDFEGKQHKKDYTGSTVLHTTNPLKVEYCNVYKHIKP